MRMEGEGKVTSRVSETERERRKERVRSREAMMLLYYSRHLHFR